LASWSTSAPPSATAIAEVTKAYTTQTCAAASTSHPPRYGHRPSRRSPTRHPPRPAGVTRRGPNGDPRREPLDTAVAISQLDPHGGCEFPTHSAATRMQSLL